MENILLSLPGFAGKDEKPIVQGYMQKQGGWMSRKFLRYFMLYKNGMLKQMDQTKDKQLKARYTLRITPNSTIT